MVKSRADLAAGAALPIAEDVRRIRAALGAALVAAVDGVREVQRVQDWAMHDGPDPSEAEQVLVARRRGARTTVLDCWKAV